MVDIQKPIKEFIEGYYEMEEMFEQVIQEKFGLVISEACYLAIKKADLQALALEKEQVVGAVSDVWPYNYGVNPPDGVKIERMSRIAAREEFLTYFARYSEMDKANKRILST